MKKTLGVIGLSVVMASSSLSNIGLAQEIKLVENLNNIKVSSEQIKEESGDINIDVNIPIIEGLNDKNYQEKKNSIIKHNIENSLKAFKKSSNSKLEFIVDFKVIKSDNILSIYVEEYKISGADANGENSITIYNIDTENSKDITLLDLFPYGSDVYEVLNKEIIRQIDLNKDKLFKEEFKGLSSKSTFYLNNKKELVLVFQQGEIAPRSEGVVEFIIPNSVTQYLKSSGILTEDKYINKDYEFELKVPENWKNKVRVHSIDKDISNIIFSYVPANPDLNPENFFTIKVRDLNSKLGDNEFEIARGKYSYVMDVFRDIPYAANTKEREEVVKINQALDGIEEIFKVTSIKPSFINNKLVVNNINLDLKNNIYDNKGMKMIPLRQVAEALGYKVEWNSKEKLAQIVDKSSEVASVKVGTNQNSYRKALIPLEDKSILKDGKTYVPASFFKEVLKLNTKIDNKGILNID